MNYVGIIQSLWFKTVKKRRANASVVKSYLDLFQQRIPELLEMVVNLSDDEVWERSTFTGYLGRVLGRICLKKVSAPLFFLKKVSAPLFFSEKSLRPLIFSEKKVFAPFFF